MEDFPSWERGNRVEYPALRGSKQADVAIIGGGLTGLSLAAMLADNGLRVILLEARRLACGASWACTGKVTAQLGSIYRTVADSAGIACARAYARMAISAVREVEDTCRRKASYCLSWWRQPARPTSRTASIPAWQGRKVMPRSLADRWLLWKGAPPAITRTWHTR